MEKEIRIDINCTGWFSVDENLSEEEIDRLVVERMNEILSEEYIKSYNWEEE